ncbi:MAG: hypothetical protein HC771_07255 [Synechococcales cyanobacterium CRU_2_2]|nr:hypothetical protein [Synechococcales cyanobacterium CRU_2_2]
MSNPSGSRTPPREEKLYNPLPPPVITTMAKLQTRLELSPYLKAQLRPFRQPKLWASIGIFGLSAFVLVRMFIQPEQFLGKAGGDRNAAANTQANQTLSPEARSIAAELDDLEVLLNEQAANGEVASGELPVNPQTKASKASKNQNKKPQVPEVEAESAEVAIPKTDYGKFESLPLVNLNPAQGLGRTAIAGQPAGFTGFNSLSGNPALNPSPGSTQQNSGNPTPLQAALDRYVPASTTMRDNNVVGGALEQAIVDTNNAAASRSVSGSGSPGNLGSGSSTSSVPPISITNPATPNAPLRATIPTDNAFTQLLNPNLTVPQTLPQVAPAAPQAGAQVQSQFQPQIQPQFQATPQFNSGLQTAPNGNPATGTAATSQSLAFPTPDFSQPAGAPVYQQPVSASSPRRLAPGQNIGGGQINTFSNP